MFEKRASKKMVSRVKFNLLSMGSAIVLAGLATPAQAQFPYWYLYAGQSLLYPLTRGLGSGFLYGPYNANPLYSTSSFLRRTAGRAAQFPYIYPYGGNAFGQSGYRNGGMPLPAPYASVDDGDGMVDPNTGHTLAPEDGPGATPNTSPNFYLPGPQTQYQNLYGTPGPSGQPQPGQQLPSNMVPNNMLPSQPIVQSTMPPKAPGHKLSRRERAQMAADREAALNQPSVTSTSVPSMALPTVLPAVSPAGSMQGPSLVSSPVSSLTPQAASISSPAAAGSVVNASGGSPLADGFVDHLVTKYDGHLGNALGNTDTRNWAKAMGLIEADHNAASLPADRIEVMGRILKDSSLDSVSKVDAVRILLKQKTQK